MKSLLHLVNGDLLASQLQGASFFETHLVFREALIVGPTQAIGMDEFWKVRTAFITSSYGVTAEEYTQKTVLEIERLNSLPEDTEICLWFEDDLFCQVNLWFILFFLAEIPKFKLSRVFPPISTTESRWAGFGQADLDLLEKCYQARIPFFTPDLALGSSLWKAYRSQDWDLFKNLSHQASPCFNSLEEVCQAQFDRLPGAHGLGKPEQILKGILAGGTTDFPLVFKEFSRQAGIYGFGDLQVKALIASLLKGKD
jgi:hypothetical protein